MYWLPADNGWMIASFFSLYTADVQYKKCSIT
jgi:hypothetical protein